MTAIEVFQFPATGANVRTVVIDGEPWFVAADVCAVLGYGGGGRNAVLRLPERMRGVAEFNTPGGLQKLAIINEPGVYRLVMRSNLTTAEEFQDWLAEDVVPAIRRTGGYEVAPQVPQSFSEALRLAADEHDRADRAEAKVLELEPSASAWNTLGSSDGDYSVREAAFILNRDPAIQIGQNRLFNVLRQWRLIDQRDVPYASHEAHVRLRPQTRPGPEEGERLPAKPQVRVTYEGLRYLHKRMGGAQPLSLETEEAA